MKFNSDFSETASNESLQNKSRSRHKDRMCSKIKREMEKYGDRFDNALSLLRDIQAGKFKYRNPDEIIWNKQKKK